MSWSAAPRTRYPRRSLTVTTIPSRLCVRRPFRSKRILAITTPCAPAADTLAPELVLMTEVTFVVGYVVVCDTFRWSVATKVACRDDEAPGSGSENLPLGPDRLRTSWPFTVRPARLLRSRT